MRMKENSVEEYFIHCNVTSSEFMYGAVYWWKLNLNNIHMYYLLLIAILDSC